MTAEKPSFLRDTLLPAALSWIEQSLLVTPVAGWLRYGRWCSSRWGDGTCAAEGSLPTCGHNPNGGDYTVPADLLDSLLVCTTCYTNGECDGCANATAGSGVAADFVVFVSAVHTSDCADGSTLAYASTCQRDQNDRPVFGYANFCPDSLSTDPALWVTQKSTAVHELLHAIGFSSTSFSLFRFDDGTPRTPRLADGLPADTTVTCHDGSSRTNVQVSSNTIVVSQARGTYVTQLVTPRVRSVARDIFGCQTLAGAEIENQPTTYSCYGSHWEQRNFMNELMAPVSSHTAVFSALTLAALEDSGWFTANYSQTGPLLWGRGKGCAFVDEPCVSSAGVPQDGFCTSSGNAGCTPDLRARGHCDVRMYSADLPSQFQWWSSQPRRGGAQTAADYCPHMIAYSNGLCELTANAPDMSSNYRGEVYGPTSSCFETTLNQNIGGYVAVSGTSQGCYPTRCSAAGTVEIQVNVSSTGGQIWLECPRPPATGVYDATVAAPAGLGVSGNIRCPEMAALLCDPSACPGLTCDGTADCVHGVCICGAPWNTQCGASAGGPSGSPSGSPSAANPPPPPPTTSPPTTSPPTTSLTTTSPPPASRSDTPPAPPDASYRLIVSCTITISGTVEAFDADAFKSALATTLGNGITAQDISLTVASASVRVDARIAAPSSAAATAAESTLVTSSVSSLSSSLGVTVEAVAAVATTTELVRASPPPVTSTDPTAVADAGRLIVVLIIVGGVAGGILLLLVVCVLVYCCLCRGSRAKTAARYPPSAAPVR